MSVIPVTPDRIEVTTLLLQPSQSFSSSSMGMTGSIFFNSRPSRAIKSFVGRNSEGDSVDSSTDSGVFLETDGVTADSDLLFSASELVKAGETDVSDLMRDYLTQVSSSSISSRQFLQTYPVRFVSSGSVSAYTFDGGVPVDRSEWTNLQRRVIKDCLVPLYRNENHMSHYAYVNYHSVSFVSSSNFGTGSALIFPNFSNTDGTRDYTPPADFTIDFFVKPKAQTDSSSRYRAGTILHLSSTFCVSLVSGSTQN